MTEPTVQADATPAIDTNEEYIQPAVAVKEPAVIASISRAIVVETVKDFFGGIAAFFMRYIRHVVRSIVYFYNPSLTKVPFNRLDFKENSQQAFEFVIIIMALLVFMIKMKWIPESDKELTDVYGNDFIQKIFDFLLFGVFAGAYLIFTGGGLLIGRMLRRMFRIDITNHESDILFVYMNNSFFTLSAIVALIVRCSASIQTHTEESIYNVIATLVFPVVIGLLLLWVVRFARLHQLPVRKAIGFALVSVILLAVYHGVCTYYLSTALVGL